MAIREGHCPMADGLGDFDTLQRLLPCFLGSAPALALGLWDQGGLIKGGKATSSVTSAKHQLHVQCLRATGCLRLLKWFQRAITSQCRVLSIAHIFGIVQVFPQHHSPFQRCQLRTFHVQAPTVHPPRKPEMEFVVGHLHLPDSDNKPFLQKGHSCGTDCRGSRGTCAPCVGVTVTAAGQPRLSVWPSDQAGWGIVLTHGFFPEPWVQTQPEELAAASEVLSLQQE